MKNVKKLSRRGLSLFLTLVMCLSMVQITVFAEGTDGAVENGPSEIIEVEQPDTGNTPEVIVPADEQKPADKQEPTGEASGEPTGETSGDPTGETSGDPTGETSGDPTGEAAGKPTGEPADDQKPDDGQEPTGDPTGETSGDPTGETSGDPTGETTGDPTGETTGEPTGEPADEQKPARPIVKDPPVTFPSQNILSEGQGPARARAWHPHNNWGPWYNAGDHEERACQYEGLITGKCDVTDSRPHSWLDDDWKVVGNEEVHYCTNGCGAHDTQSIQLGTYPVYVYVKVNGSTDNVNFGNLNDSDWFTVGKVMVEGLPNPKRCGKDYVLSEDNDPNIQKAVAAVKMGLDNRYEQNKDLDLTDKIAWTGTHTAIDKDGKSDTTLAGLKVATGANGYKDETGDSNLVWHLDGVLTISEKYTVTYNDGVDNETVFEDQTTSNLKYADETPEFQVNGKAANPTREGYVFKGWEPTVSYRVTGNVTYKAQWEKKEANLEVEKAAYDSTGYGSIESVKPGDTIKYRITVTNKGDTEVKNVVITDVLDDSLEFVRAESNFGAKLWETAPEDGKYTVGTLDTTATQGKGIATLTITVTVKDGATGTIRNTATVDCDNTPATKPSDTADVTVAKPITLTYDAGEGTGAPEAETKNADADGNATFTVGAAPTAPEGKKFVKWYKGTSDYQPGSSITISQNTTLKALWETTTPVGPGPDPDPTYTLKVIYEFYLDDVKQENLTRTAVNQEMTKGSTYNVVIPETLDGYTTKETDKLNQTLTEDTEIVVRYDKTTPPKQIIYQWLPGYGGTDANTPYFTATITEGEAAPTYTETPTREGYAFKGWSDPADGANKDGVKTVTYTAQWVKTYTVTFNSDGGSAVANQTVEENGKAVKPADPTRSGYTFNGWRAEGVTSDYDFDSAVTGDIALVAQWSRNSSGNNNSGNNNSGNNNSGNNDNNNEPVVDVPDPDVPLVDIPEVDPPLVDVPEVDPPLVDVPDVDVPLVDIPDEDVPLADIPKTDDLSLLWHATALLSAAGLMVLAALERKQRREK